MQDSKLIFIFSYVQDFVISVCLWCTWRYVYQFMAYFFSVKQIFVHCNDSKICIFLMFVFKNMHYYSSTNICKTRHAHATCKEKFHYIFC